MGKIYIYLLISFVFSSGISAQIFNTSSCGLPIGKTNCFIKNSSGDIYVGSDNGLFVYHAGAIDCIFPASIHGVNDISIDNQGNLWLATNHTGVVKISGNNLTIFNSLNSIVPDNVDRIEALNSSDIWIGSDNKVLLLNGLSIFSHTFPSSSYNYMDLEKHNGSIYIICKDSLYKTVGNQIIPVAQISSNVSTAHKMLNDAFDSLWICSEISVYKLIGNVLIDRNSAFPQFHPNSVGIINKYCGISEYDNHSIICQSSLGLYLSNGQQSQGSIMNWGGIFNPAEYNTSVYCAFGKVFTGTTNGFVMFDQSLFASMTNEFENIDQGNIRASIYSNGNLFNNVGNDANGFEVPINSGLRTMYLANIWIGAMDDNQQLHICAQRFSQVGRDFFIGPIANNYYSNGYISKYNRVWKINETEINNHIQNFHTIGYVMPEVIANWPGNGNTSNGEAPILAPFADLNNNGIYEPILGEYPSIRGTQAIYFITNDNRFPHSESGGVPLNIEIHGMAYVDIDTSQDLQNTVFLHYTIHNRSLNDYTGVRVGLWTDPDVGYSRDDYIGCDTLINSFFAYNGAPIDTEYGSSAPAVGVTFLSHPMKSFCYFNNLGLVPSYMDDPSTPQEYYNYLNGKFADGSPLTYGGNGYGGSIITNYAFSGDPLNPLEWSEVSINSNPFDRRGVAVIGPDILPAGQSLCFDFAFVNDQEITNGNNLSNIDPLKKRISVIRSHFFQKQYDCLYYEHNYILPNMGNAIDTLNAFVDTCLVDPYTIVDTAYIDTVTVIGSIAYVDWIIVQNGDSLILLNVPYLMSNSGIHSFMLSLICNNQSGNKTLNIFTFNQNYYSEPKEEQPYSEDEILLFPNPSNGQFSILLPQNLCDCDMRLYNPMGQLVQEFHLTQASNSFYISNLSQGNYIIILSKDNVVATKKITITH